MLSNPRAIEALEIATKAFFTHLKGEGTNAQEKALDTLENKKVEAKTKAEKPKKLTIDDLRTAAQGCMAKHDKAYAIKIVNDFGYKSINDVPEEKYAQLINLLI